MATINDVKAATTAYQSSLDELRAKQNTVEAAVAKVAECEAALLAAVDAKTSAEEAYRTADDAAEKVLGKVNFVSEEIGVVAQDYVPPVDPPPVEPTV